MTYSTVKRSWKIFHSSMNLQTVTTCQCPHLWQAHWQSLKRFRLLMQMVKADSCVLSYQTVKWISKWSNHSWKKLQRKELHTFLSSLTHRRTQFWTLRQSNMSMEKCKSSHTWVISHLISFWLLTTQNNWEISWVLLWCNSFKKSDY